MSSLLSSVDVAVIGAGAAGLGAAHALKDSGLSFIVLEARDRAGGRGHTVMVSPEITFDLGCGWLHSADQNTFVPIAGGLGFEIDKTLPPWRERAWGKAFPQGDRNEFIRSLDEFFQRIHDAAKSGRDSAASLYLEPGNRWNPMIDAISTYINGAETDRVSILDFDAYEDTNRNWRIRRGYGALMAAYGASLPIAFKCTVTLIDHSGTRLRIETTLGTLAADKVIVTVPTNLIADEAVRFHPALPDKVDAAAHCRLAWPTRSCSRSTSPMRCRRTAICAVRRCAPKWGPIICARSGSPASRASSAGAMRGRWKTKVAARSRRHRSTRSPASSATTFAAN